jgi:hypothetical protein
VRGHPQDLPRAEQASGSPGRQILLPDVRPVGSCGQREIQAVVYDENRGMGSAKGLDGAGLRQEHAQVPRLVPELDHIRPAVQGGGRDGHVVSACEIGIRDHAEVQSVEHYYP